MADTKISAFTAGGSAIGTDRMAAARTPFASGNNVYLTPAYLKTYTLGLSSTDTLTFFGATATAQAGSTTAVTGTAAASITATQWGFSTSTQADALIALVRAIHANLISLGLKAP